jgi:heme/copper-type cytochrome/quinol oxidase subunit 2
MRIKPRGQAALRDIQPNACNFFPPRVSESHMKKLIVLALLLIVTIVPVGCRRDSAPTDHIKVVMKKYSIDPPVIRIRSGETVELLISTADVQHGFDVPKLSIKQPIQPGQTVSVILHAPPKGEYEVVCGIICGPHHDDMGGKLIVE